MTTVDAGDLPALLALAEAAGGVHRLSLTKFRVLDIVCAEHGARMAQVIGTPQGRVLVADTRDIWQDHSGAVVSVPEGERGTQAGRALDGSRITRRKGGRCVALLLADADPQYRVACLARCGTVTVWPAWIGAQLDKGRARVRISHADPGSLPHGADTQTEIDEAVRRAKAARVGEAE